MHESPATWRGPAAAVPSTGRAARRRRAGEVARALLSCPLNAFVYRPFQRRGAPAVSIVIVSLGMLLILEFGTQAWAGPTNVAYSMSQGATLTAGSIVLTVAQITIIAISIAAMAVVHVLIRYTRLGKAM